MRSNGNRVSFPRSLRAWLVSERTIHWLMVIPIFAFFIPLQIIPIGMGFVYSLADWNGLGRTINWVGLGNYQELSTDPYFWSSVGVTLRFVAYAVPFILVLSLIIAVALNTRTSRLIGPAKVAVLVPIALSPVAIGILFTLLASPSIGLPTVIVGKKIDLLAGDTSALLTVAAAHIWGSVGFNTFIFLAGLQAIPDTLYEAAMIDGAGPRQRFFRVTLPLLRETTILNLIIIFISAFRTFGLIYSMTYGGPYRATEVLAMYMYRETFVSWRLGYGSAVAFVLFVVIATVTFFQLRITRAGSRRFY